MKKIVLIVIAFYSLNMYSQDNEVNVGINAGLTIGNIKNTSSVAFGVDVNYLFDLFENIKIGPSLNFIYYSTKEINGNIPDALMYLPIGGAIRFNSSGDKFYVGADAGFAIGISPEGDNGGVFFKPMLGYYASDKIKLNLFYSGVKKKQPTYGYLGVGIVYNVFGGGNAYIY